MNYTDGYHGGRDKSGRIMAVCIMADLINHAPTDESRLDGSIKMPAFPWATTKVAVWKGRHYVLCQMRSELSGIRLQPSGFLFSLYP